MDTLRQDNQLQIVNLAEIQSNPGRIRYGEIKPITLKDMLKNLGNTPLVCLEQSENCKLSAKIEGTNPCASVKARTAAYMLKDAIEKDMIDRQLGIVIGSGGNYAIAMAALCAAENIPLTVSLLQSAPDSFARLLVELGAQVLKDSATRDERRELTLDLAGQGYCFLDQHNSPQALLAVGQTLGPEIMQQTQGTVTDIVAGFGTGMTVFGNSIYFKNRYREGKIDKPVTITAVEDDLSVLEFQLQSLPFMNASDRVKRQFIRDYQQRTGRKLRIYDRADGSISSVAFYIGERAVDDIPGIGISGLQPAVQELLQINLIDKVIQIEPSQAYAATRTLQTKGLNVGISSGAAYLAGKQLFEAKKQQGLSANIVTIFPDTGLLYQDILYQ